MAIGETFLSAFLQVLFEKMLSPGVNLFMELLKGGKQQQIIIKEWEKQLRMIEAVLSDAEFQSQFQTNNSNNGINAWMQDLQDLAYDLEDVLDTFATQALTYHLMIKEDDRRRKSKDNNPKLMVCQLSLPLPLL
ncbi:putative disease resistance RPP13-like protein 1 [Bienertia sinuspersici]